MKYKARIDRIRSYLDTTTPDQDTLKKLHEKRIANLKKGLTRFFGNKTQDEIDAIVPAEVARWENEVQERRRKWGCAV